MAGRRGTTPTKKGLNILFPSAKILSSPQLLLNRPKYFIPFFEVLSRFSKFPYVGGRWRGWWGECCLPWTSMHAINLQCSFVEITLLHAYFPENLPHIFRTSFTRKLVADCFWNLNMFTWTLWESWNSLSISNFLMSLSVPDNEFITSNSVSSTFHYFQSKALNWPTVLICFFLRKFAYFWETSVGLFRLVCEEKCRDWLLHHFNEFVGSTLKAVLHSVKNLLWRFFSDRKFLLGNFKSFFI